MPDLSGLLSVLPLKQLIVHLGARQASGALDFEYADVHKRVFLHDGIVVHASSNQAREYLGQFLMNLGLLTEEQFVKAYAVQRTTHVPLGQVVVQDGLVSEQTLRRTLEVKFRETLLDAFGWDDGVFTYDSAATPPEERRLEASVGLLEIVKEGEYRDSVWPAIREVFPRGQIRLRVNEGKLLPELPSDSLDARLLRLAREGMTLDEMALSLHASDYFLYPRLYALFLQGVVELDEDGTPPAHRPASASSQGRLTLDSLRVKLRSRPLVPVSKVPTSDLRSLPLRPEERYLLSRMDGARDLGAIVDAAPLSELEGLSLIDALQERGVIELREVTDAS